MKENLRINSFFPGQNAMSEKTISCYCLFKRIYAGVWEPGAGWEVQQQRAGEEDAGGVQAQLPHRQARPSQGKTQKIGEVPCMFQQYFDRGVIVFTWFLQNRIILRYLFLNYTLAKFWENISSSGPVRRTVDFDQIKFGEIFNINFDLNSFVWDLDPDKSGYGTSQVFINSVESGSIDL